MASILSQTTAEADARLVAVMGEPDVAGFKLIRCWPWLAANAASGGTVHSLVVTLSAVTSYTDPKADDVVYSGTFVHSGCKAVEETEQGESDRAASIIQTLTKVNAPANISALAALTPEIIQQNMIQEHFSVATGEKDRILYRYKNLNPSARSAMIGLADADLVSNLPGSGWTYVDRKFEQEDDGTATFSVLFEQEAWQSAATNAAAQVTEVEASVGAQRAGLRRVWYRRTLAAKQSLITLPADDATDWVTSTAYVIGDVVENTDTYVCLIAHTSGTFATDLSAGKWTACTGVAKTAYTHLGTAYTHLSVRAEEGSDGSWTVTQLLTVPRTTISVDDNEGEILWHAAERIVQTAQNTWANKLITTYRQIFSSAASAAAYADGGTAIFDENHTSLSHQLGYVQYAGDGKWHGFKVTLGTPGSSWSV